MKTPKHQYVFYIVVTVIESLLALVVAMLNSSDILPYTKGTLIFLSVIGGNAAVFFITRFFYVAATKSVLEQAGKGTEEIERLRAECLRKDDEIKMLQSKLYAMAGEESDMVRLRQKCEAIEKFRNSFPLAISENYTIYNIMRIDLQTGDYSKWQIVGEYQDELWSYTLLRTDTQTFKEMLMLVSATKEPAGLKEINLGTELLYM